MGRGGLVRGREGGGRGAALTKDRGYECPVAGATCNSTTKLEYWNTLLY